MIERMTSLCIQETLHVERVFCQKMRNICMQMRVPEAHQGKGTAFSCGERCHAHLMPTPFIGQLSVMEMLGLMGLSH